MSDNLRKQEKKHLIHCKIYKLIKVKKAHLINKRGQKGPRIKQKRPKNIFACDNIFILSVYISYIS